jgi:hypothetical protein
MKKWVMPRAPKNAISPPHIGKRIVVVATVMKLAQAYSQQRSMPQQAISRHLDLFFDNIISFL